MYQLQLVEIRKAVGVDRRALAGVIGMPVRRLSDAEDFNRRVHEALQGIQRNRLKVIGRR